MSFSSDKVLALINTRNGSEFTPVNVEISLPIPNEDPVVNRNTQVTLTAVEAEGLLGKRTFHYDRLNLDKIRGGRDIRIKIPVEPNTVEDILPYVNAHFGVTLELSDLDGEPLTGTWRNARRMTQITASPNSHLWTGTIVFVLWVFPTV